MGRLPKAVQQTVTLDRINPNVAFTDTPNMLASISNSANNLSNALLQKKQEYRAVEEEKQKMLSTIDMNKSHAEMGRRIQVLQKDVEKNYADKPVEGQQYFTTEVAKIKQEYDDKFSDDLYAQSRWSGISESVNGEALINIDSWKSSQQTVNATKDYRNTQSLRIQSAGDSNNLAELYKVYRESNTDYQVSKGIFAGTDFDALADHQKQLNGITKEFLNGQLDRAPGSIEAYLKDPMIEHHLSEAEKNDYKDLSKRVIRAKEAEAEEASAYDHMEWYHNTYIGIKTGTVTIGQLNAKINQMRETKAPKSQLEQVYQLRDMLVNQTVDYAKEKQKEEEKLLSDTAKAQREQEARVERVRTYDSIYTQYMTLYVDKSGKTVTPKNFKGNIEQTTKLLQEITEAERKGVQGLDGMRKMVMASITRQLENGSTVYKTRKKSLGPDDNNPFNNQTTDVPIDDKNRNIKAVYDSVNKAYGLNVKGEPNISGRSVRALAITDIMNNYEKYKQQGMTDQEITNFVVQSAQKVHRGEVQQNVDALWRQKQISKQGGLTYYSKNYIPALSKKLGMKLTVTSTYRPGDPGMHGKGRAVDVSMSEHSLANKIKFFSEELSNPNLQTLGTSDPAILKYFAGNPKIHDLRQHDKSSGDNHVNHVHITLKQGNTVLASKYNFNSENAFNAYLKNNKIADGTIVIVAGKKYKWSN